MPILKPDILRMQQEGALDGQLRIGTSTPGKNGGKSPVKLTTWRITSKSRVAVMAAAAKFGGEARPWASDRGPQWEVVTPLSELPVEFGGGATVDQWMTHYDKGIPMRRCTGAADAVNEISGRPCECNATGRELCKPETKLLVRFLDLPGVGWWRFTSHGIFVATSFPAKAKFLVTAEAHLNAVAMARGDFEAKYVPARLVLGEMKLPPKEPGGSGRRFPVVDIDIDVSVAQVLAGEGVGTLREIVSARRPLAIEPGVPAALPAVPSEPAVAASTPVATPTPPERPASDEPSPVRAQRCADAALRAVDLDGDKGLRNIAAWASREGLLDEWVSPATDAADSLLRDVLADAMERLTPAEAATA